MAMYLIAVKREKRREMSLVRAVEVLHDVPGVRVLDDPTESASVRVLVKDHQDYEALSRRLSPWCHIELLIEHYPQQAI